MISRPTFHTFLTLSVLVILIGIAVIIFTQFDRGSIALDDQQKDYSGQQKLIRQIVEKTQQSNTEVKPRNPPVAQQSVLNLIEQVKSDDKDSNFIAGDTPKTVTDQEIARINQLNDQPYSTAQPSAPYPYSGYGYGNGYGYNNTQDYWLSNNPWSPYYDPNRR